jgi:para-nitrobenzyl esterase
MGNFAAAACTAVVATLLSLPAAAETSPVPVNVSNFARAETDMYFGRTVKEAGLGRLTHRRQMIAIDQQSVVRMNRDTLYSSAVFDLQAAPVTITLPDSGRRFMSMQLVTQDHFSPEVVYAPGTYTYTKDKVGTRYMQVIVRTLADPQDPADVKAANALQDAIKAQQTSAGTFEVPAWDPVSQKKARDALLALGALGVTGPLFGKQGEINPINHLIGAAGGWGGNPPSAAVYAGVFPPANDGTTVHSLTVKDVPVDGFWSISVYNKEGFFEKNDLGAYSVNNLTAKANADGSYTIHFGGCTPTVANCLPIVAGWNYTVRLYRPRAAILDGSWTFPEAVPVP